MNQPTRQPGHLDWWAPVWRGLVVAEDGKHRKAIKQAVWLYLYLIIHADRRTGQLYRKQQTIARDMGLSLRSVQQWLAVLRRRGYIQTHSTGRASLIEIGKWRALPSSKR